MDLQNLKEHHEELLSFMENNGYSSTYIRRFREEINRILAKADSHDWQSYRDVYLDYLKAPHSKDYLRNKRTIIGALEQFDDFGRMPDGRSRHTLFERGSYHLLCSEFRVLIDFYRIYEKKRGKKESTIRGEALNAASFLHQMQQRGAQCLDAITEEDVLSFFLAEDGSLQRSCSYKKNIAAVVPSAEDGNQQLLQVEDLCGRQLRSFSEHAGPVQCSAAADSPERKAEIPPACLYRGRTYPVFP